MYRIITAEIINKLCKQDETIYGITFSKEEMQKILSDEHPFVARAIVSAMKITEKNK